MEGRLVIGMNVHREICVLGMAGGFALLPDQLLRCVKIATVKCQEFTEEVQNALTTTSTTAAKSELVGSSSILETRRGVEEVRVVRSETGEGGEGQVKVVDEQEEEEEEEGDVVYLGEGTARVGLGGRSQWTLDTEEGRDDKEDTGDDVIIIDDEEVEKTEVLVSSSEEEVVVLTQADIGGFTKPEPSPTREGEGGRRGMRGKRGGRTTPRGPGATETSAERGRGRNKRKKNRKKQQN
ncbi:Exosome complex component RRP45 [Geodia barretti]|nr:Exosome complex component RRP45 [Geodia barretti]